MTHDEAVDYAERVGAHDTIERTEIIRILPEDEDPIIDGDGGWDVLVTVK